MDARRSRRFVMWGVGLLFVVVASLIVIHNLNKSRQGITYQEIAHLHEANGVMSAAVEMHMFDIRDKVTKSHSISDEDLNWLLDQLKINDIPSERKQLARFRLMEPIKLLENVPPEQKGKIFQAVLPMLGNASPFGDTLDKTTGSNVMRIINDKRAIPYLVPLLSDTDENVREHAQDALNFLGYKPSG